MGNWASRHDITEDITVGAAVTYATGGITLTVTQAAQIQKGSISISSTALGIWGTPVAGSEGAGQTFKAQFWEPGSSGTAQNELASGSTALQSAVIRVRYRGN